MRRPFPLLMAGLISVIAVSSAFLIGSTPASAAPIAAAPTTYCADPDTDPSIDTGAGTMITCETTITNTITGIDPVTGVASGSAVITVKECTGPANGRLDPSVLTCTTDEQILVNLVTHVDQCNGVGYGGGNVLDCTVDVINNFVGVTPEVIGAASVNQCNGSAPVTTGCNPFPATTTNATITQCNNSSYGGGQEDFNCDASGTTTASLSVTVDQCNDSNYGGGSWLNCATTLANNVFPLASATPTAAVATATANATPTLAATPTAAATPTLAATPTAAATPAPAATSTPKATPTLAATATPAATPSELPDTSTLRPPTPPQGGNGFTLLLIGVFLLAFPLWKIYADRAMPVR